MDLHATAALRRTLGWRYWPEVLGVVACALPFWYFAVPALSNSGYWPLVFQWGFAGLGLAGAGAAFVRATRRWRIFAVLSGQDLVIRGTWRKIRIPLAAILSAERKIDRVIIRHTSGRAVVDDAYFQGRDEAGAFSLELAEQIARRNSGATRAAKPKVRKIVSLALLAMLLAELAGIAFVHQRSTEREERLLPLELRSFLAAALDTWSLENPNADIAWAEGGFLTPELIEGTLKAPEILGLCKRNFALRPASAKEAPAFSNLRILGAGSSDSSGRRYLNFAIVVSLGGKVCAYTQVETYSLADFRQLIVRELEAGAITPSLAKTHLRYIASLEKNVPTENQGQPFPSKPRR